MKKVNFDQDYKVIKKLGFGTYASTYLVHEAKDPSKKLVAKILESKNSSENSKSLRCEEITFLSKLRHPNIVQLYDSFEDESQGKTYILLEYCQKGDLGSFIVRRKKTGILFQEHLIISWMHQLLSALLYLHANKVIHRDLKPSNILIADDFSLKLCDFGVSRQLDFTAQFACTMIGTPYYLSPEMCLKEEYTYKTDIWSLGCVFYEIATLERLFQTESLIELLTKILDFDIKNHLIVHSEKFHNLVSMMLKKNPNERATAQVLLSTEIFQQRTNSIKQKFVKDYSNEVSALQQLVNNTLDNVTSQLEKSAGKNFKKKGEQNKLNFDNAQFDLTVKSEIMKTLQIPTNFQETFNTNMSFELSMTNSDFLTLSEKDLRDLEFTASFHNPNENVENCFKNETLSSQEPELVKTITNSMDSNDLRNNSSSFQKKTNSDAENSGSFQLVNELEVETRLSKVFKEDEQLQEVCRLYQEQLKEKPLNKYCVMEEILEESQEDSIKSNCQMLNNLGSNKSNTSNKSESSLKAKDSPEKSLNELIEKVNEVKKKLVPLFGPKYTKINEIVENFSIKNDEKLIELKKLCKNDKEYEICQIYNQLIQLSSKTRR